MAQPATAAVRLLTGEREPVRLATTANIALYGLQTIDGTMVEVGDRVLVKDQADATQNGIYTASEGEWYRAADARTTRTLQKGTTVHTQIGVTNADRVFEFTADEPAIGTDPIVAVPYLPPDVGQASADAIAAKDAAQTAATAAATQASIATTQAGTATAQAVIATDKAALASTASTTAMVARDASLYGKGVFPTTAAGIALGIVGASAMVGGSGGTNGTFDLAFTGGTGSGAAGRFVVSGGALTAIVITAPGSYTVAPTLSFAASAGLTGASASAILGRNSAVGEYFWAPVGSDDMALYRVDTGPVATDTTVRLSSGLTALRGQVVRRNMFDQSNRADGYFVSHTTGVLTANVSYYTSAFIPLIGGANYIFSAIWFLAWYDGSGTFISGKNYVGGAFAQVEAAPAGAAFCRFSVFNPAVNVPSAVMMSPGTSLPTAYTKYNEVVDGAAVFPATLTGRALAPATVTPDKVTFLLQSKNLFNKATATDGFISASGSITTPSGTYSLSDYIPVAASTAYHGEGTSNMRTWCFFSDIGVVLAGGSNAPGTDFTTPAGCKYVRISVTTNDLAGFQLEAGSSKTGYSKYGYSLSPDAGGSAAGGWANKKWGAIGDSNVAGDAWPGMAAAAVGLTFTDFGIGGTWLSGPPDSTTAMFSDTRINAVPTSYDLITLMGGTNDDFNNVPLGLPTSLTSTEYNGALNIACQKLIDRFPTKVIMLVTPPWTEILPANVAAKGWANEYTNTLGLTPADYADAVRAAGKRYNLPVIDLQAEEGVNHRNIASRRINDGNYLHFELTVAAPRVAAIHAAAFRRQAPVV